MVNRITGEEIIEEILGNMIEGLEPLRYSVLVPGLYHIYLHESDFIRLEPVFPQIIREAKQALDETIESHNNPGVGWTDLVANVRSRIPASLVGRNQTKITARKKYQAPNDGWQISFHRDLNSELLPGDICIQSQLTLPIIVELGGGNETKTIKTLRRNGVSRKTHESPQPRFVSSSVAPENNSVVTGTNAVDGRPKDSVLGVIHYNDINGKQIFEITKNQIVVGRGGDGYWVDLRLDVDTKISREHFRLRRDEETGRFYIKDLSVFGTTVNGQPVATSVQVVDGERRDINVEVELPIRARIGLAGVFIIDFEAHQ